MSKRTASKILFLSPYPYGKAPSQRLKYEQYFRIFEQEGYELEVSSFMDEALWKIIYKRGNLLSKIFGIVKGYCRRTCDLFRVGNFDLVYIHLWTTPIGGTLYEYLFSKMCRKLVYDIDDMVFTKHSSEANLGYSFLKGRKKPVFLMKKADHIICGTPTLEEFVKQFNSNTTVIPTTIDTDRYLPKKNYNIQEIPIIGWSGSHSTAKYLLLLTETLKKIKTEKDFILKVIGDEDFGMTGVDFQSYAWNIKTELGHLESFDIGINPMPNEEWVNGKSGGKTLLYMSMGIPTIASATGPNLLIIENGLDGILVNSINEWEAKLKEMMGNMDLREKVGRNGRKKVEEEYSLKANKHKYLTIFKTLTEI